MAAFLPPAGEDGSLLRSLWLNPALGLLPTKAAPLCSSCSSHAQALLHHTGLLGKWFLPDTFGSRLTIIQHAARKGCRFPVDDIVVFMTYLKQ